MTAMTSKRWIRPPATFSVKPPIHIRSNKTTSAHNIEGNLLRGIDRTMCATLGAATLQGPWALMAEP